MGTSENLARGGTVYIPFDQVPAGPVPSKRETSNGIHLDSYGGAKPGGLESEIESADSREETDCGQIAVQSEYYASA